eukprot:TRINITY_DN934_c0_g1_i2.p1 TRINITY_DN934_c0_g1~~TRINITY_DN934_c0_g1_i2.p1  ORF type:complete len:135 (-),score=45.11 TRINITY_DN934_c0_g1_i2:402-806(-)
MLTPEAGFCQSNTDEQLLVNIGFREKVKVFSLIIQGVENFDDNAPLNVRIYTNKRMGFMDVDDHKPEQELELSLEQAMYGQPIKLNFVRFQNVSSVSVFIETNQGMAESTMISRLVITGMPIAGTDMNALKKVG